MKKSHLCRGGATDLELRDGADKAAADENYPGGRPKPP